MALFRRFFYRKPPDRLLEISDRVYVFDCCFSSDVLDEDEYSTYMNGIVAQLQDHYPDAAFMVFNFKEGEMRSQLSAVLSQYDMTVMDYPQQYEGCQLLPMQMMNHFLRSSESWLSLQNVLLMHCERGGWPVLAFMLAGLLLYRKQYTGEQKTLEMVYKQAPKELLHLLSPLNPQPSQLRYLQYISKRNIGLDWPPSDTPLDLDCMILRILPLYDGGRGCRPVVRVYGQDPSSKTSNRRSKLLFSTSKVKKHIRLYQQEECELVKIDIHCRVQGDVVLECIHLEDDLVMEEMIFRIMFHTAFVRANVLMLTRDEVDVLWDAKDQFSKEFRAEVIFSDADSLPPIKITTDVVSEDGDETEEVASPEEFFEAEEIFSSVVDGHDGKGESYNDTVQVIAQEEDESSHHIVERPAFLDCASDVGPIKNLLRNGDTQLEESTPVTADVATNVETKSENAGTFSKSKEVDTNQNEMLRAVIADMASNAEIESEKAGIPGKFEAEENNQNLERPSSVIADVASTAETTSENAGTGGNYGEEENNQNHEVPLRSVIADVASSAEIESEKAGIPGKFEEEENNQNQEMPSLVIADVASTAEIESEKAGILGKFEEEENNQNQEMPSSVNADVASCAKIESEKAGTFSKSKEENNQNQEMSSSVITDVASSAEIESEKAGIPGKFEEEENYQNHEVPPRSVIDDVASSAEIKSENAGTCVKSEEEKNKQNQEAAPLMKKIEKQKLGADNNKYNSNKAKKQLTVSKSASDVVGTSKKSKLLAKPSAVSRWIPSNKGSYSNSMHVYYPPSRHNSAPAMLALGKDGKSKSTAFSEAKAKATAALRKSALARGKHASWPSALDFPPMEEASSPTLPSTPEVECEAQELNPKQPPCPPPPPPPPPPFRSLLYKTSSPSPPTDASLRTMVPVTSIPPAPPPPPTPPISISRVLPPPPPPPPPPWTAGSSLPLPHASSIHSPPSTEMPTPSPAPPPPPPPPPNSVCGIPPPQPPVPPIHVVPFFAFA